MCSEHWDQKDRALTVLVLRWHTENKRGCGADVSKCTVVLSLGNFCSALSLFCDIKSGERLLHGDSQGNRELLEVKLAQTVLKKGVSEQHRWAFSFLVWLHVPQLKSWPCDRKSINSPLPETWYLKTVQQTFPSPQPDTEHEAFCYWWNIHGAASLLGTPTESTLKLVRGGCVSVELYVAKTEMWNANN